MATRPDTTAIFIAKLLAPLPDGEEPVDTKVLRKQIERDNLLTWANAMERVRLAEAKHTTAALEWRLDGGPNAENLAAYCRLIAEQRRQCLIPAPTAKELRWKKRLMQSTIDTPEIKAAIAADEARLGGN